MTASYDPDRFRRVDALFDAALKLAPPDRNAFLDSMCGGDLALRTEIHSLLDSVGTAESEFGEHVGEYAAALISQLPTDLDDPALEPGTTLGAWRIEREIGRGGMGSVYLAERADGAFELRAAVKVVKRGMDTAEVLRRFHAERRILASLDHPNVARLMDGGATADGRPYLVMEYVEGDPIDRWCDAQHLDTRARVALFGRVCEAVHEAHRRLIVHRDVKPTNVLVTASGMPKLLDFGIARLLDSDMDATITGARVLTPAYAAPEQKTGAPITTATDVFSLGVLLHELITGERPIGAGVDRHPDSQRATAGTRRPPAELQTIVQRATAVEPDRRYGSALQLAEDLDRWLRGMPVLARSDTLAYRAAKFIRRNRVAVSAGCVAALTAVAFAFAMAAAQRRTAAALMQAETERDTAEEVAALLEDLFSAGDPTALRRERLDTLRVSALLERSSNRVRDELTNRPAVQARLLRALGDAYRGMGLFEAAEPLLQDAVTVYRSVGDSTALADALNSAGLLELERGRSIEAGPWLEEAVAIQRTLPVTDPSRLGRMLSNLAATRQNANDVERAIALYDEAEQLVGSAAVPDTGLLSIILNGRATMAQRAGDFEGAAAAAERILAIDRARLGESHPRIAIDLANIAFMHQRLGRIQLADSIQSQSLEMLRATVGTDHVLYFRSLASLANIRAELGNTDEARALFVESIAAMRRSMNESSELGITLSQYASLLAAVGEPLEAESTIREAIAIERRANGVAHPNVGILTTQLARVRCTHDSDSAPALFQDALDILERDLPPAHARVIDARRSLGACLTSTGEFSEAEAVLLAAFESVGGSREGVAPGADLPRPARDVAAALGDLYAAWQRHGEAAAYRAWVDAQNHRR